MRTLTVIVLVLWVGGCATQAQRQHESVAAGARAAQEQKKACSTANYNSREAAPLHSHIPLVLPDATLEQLSDPSRITDQEKAALLAVRPRAMECRKAFLDALSRSAPSMVPIYAEGYARADDNLLALLKGEEAWGTFVRRARDITITSDQELQAEAQRIEAGFRAEYQAEMEQRQRAAAIMLQWSQTQQMINAINRPTPYVMQPTISPIINCTSSQIGSQIFTNCR